MTGPDYEVSPAVLAEAATAIEAVPAPSGVAQLALLPGDVGHAALSSAFVAFCDRWEWGVRDAVRVGEDVADDLRTSAAAYGHADGAGKNLLARFAFDLVGDPAGVGETWADVGASLVPDRGMPDWGELGGQWADAADDLAARSWPGMIARALRGADPFAGQLDDLSRVVE